ncbi:MAG: GxxExxY protein [Leptospiraceae bacterium]|nr:GxxExxY protein [Leptospiraceae bacterium]
MMAELLYYDESYAIRGRIFEVYRVMGSGFLESVYQECLAKEFAAAQIPYLEQPELELNYKGAILKSKFKPDFICYGEIIIELKAVKMLLPEHKAQLLNYLKITGKKLGFLVNFAASPQVELIRMVA